MPTRLRSCIAIRAVGTGNLVIKRARTRFVDLTVKLLDLKGPKRGGQTCLIRLLPSEQLSPQHWNTEQWVRTASELRFPRGTAEHRRARGSWSAYSELKVNARKRDQWLSEFGSAHYRKLKTSAENWKRVRKPRTPLPTQTNTSIYTEHYSILCLQRYCKR